MNPRYIFVNQANGWIYDTKDTIVYKLLDPEVEPTPARVLRAIDAFYGGASYDYEELPLSVAGGNQCDANKGEIILVYLAGHNFNLNFKEEYDMERVQKISNILPLVGVLRRSYRKLEKPRYIFTNYDAGWIRDTKRYNNQVYRFFEMNVDPTPIQISLMFDRLIERSNKYCYEELPLNAIHDEYDYINGEIVFVYSPDPELDIEFEDFPSDKRIIQFIPHMLPFFCALQRIRIKTSSTPALVSAESSDDDIPF